MSKDSRKLAAGFLASILLVAGVALLASTARADGPPQEVIENAAAMKANQKVLEKNREAHEAFTAAKLDNERREKQNNELGWRTDWSSLNPVPLAARL